MTIIRPGRYSKITKKLSYRPTYTVVLNVIQCTCIHGIFDNDDVDFQGRNDSIIYFANHHIAAKNTL